MKQALDRTNEDRLEARASRAAAPVRGRNSDIACAPPASRRRTEPGNRATEGLGMLKAIIAVAGKGKPLLPHLQDDQQVQATGPRPAITARRFTHVNRCVATAILIPSSSPGPHLTEHQILPVHTPPP
jgi:hypothetical protein